MAVAECCAAIESDPVPHETRTRLHNLLREAAQKYMFADLLLDQLQRAGFQGGEQYLYNYSAEAAALKGEAEQQLAAARLVGGTPRPPPPNATQFAFHAAAAAAAPGASAPSAFHDKLHESFHEKLQRVKRQLLVDPNLPVSSM